MLLNRNVRVGGGKTSMRLEPSFWNALDEICARECLTMSELMRLLDQQRDLALIPLNRTEAVRVFVLGYYRAAVTEEGHEIARHGEIHQRGRREVRQLTKMAA